MTASRILLTSHLSFVITVGTRADGRSNRPRLRDLHLAGQPGGRLTLGVHREHLLFIGPGGRPDRTIADRRSHGQVPHAASPPQSPSMPGKPHCWSRPASVTDLPREAPHTSRRRGNKCDNCHSGLLACPQLLDTSLAPDERCGYVRRSQKLVISAKGAMVSEPQ